MLDQTRCAELETLLDMCYKIYEMYNWLLNAYVSDFFVQNYWQKLPKCWQEALKDCELEAIGNIIHSQQALHIKRVLPLSLLSLRQSIKHLQIPRWQRTDFLLNDVNLDEDFKRILWKRVKLKKKHEIELMAKLCHKLGINSKCHCIVDIGSGIGHLSRLLAYGYRFTVCSFEAQEYLTLEARKLDQCLEHSLSRKCKGTSMENLRPVHINMEIKCGGNILEDTAKVFKMETDEMQFGIVGLHPCGDLGATLLQYFSNFSQIKFIAIVGCCYMKLSETQNSLCKGYPLSHYCLEKSYNLTYASREVACHALEEYVQKLCGGQYWLFKIHSYRALLEKLIVEKWPYLHHSQVNSVRYSEDLSFYDYCIKAASKLGIDMTQLNLDSNKIQDYLDQWKEVVIFYSLRLMIAPLIETIILMDRILYILESGYQCGVVPIFDPHKSPRNQVLIAAK